MSSISDKEGLDYKVNIGKGKGGATSTTENKVLREEQENTRKYKITTIILGVIALLGIAGTVYFMSFNIPSNMIHISKSNAQKHALQNEVDELKENIKNISMNQELNATGQDRASLNDELVYAVQIGAFKKKNLSLYSNKFVNFKEIKSGDFNKYALGNFATLSEAKKFRRELIGLGFRQAFIASYQNGKRIKIEEAW